MDLEVLNPLFAGCACAGCRALRRELSDGDGVPDMRLVRLYGRKLLVRNWAGKTSNAERLYRSFHWNARSATHRPIDLGHPG